MMISPTSLVVLAIAVVLLLSFHFFPEFWRGFCALFIAGDPDWLMNVRPDIRTLDRAIRIQLHEGGMIHHRLEDAYVMCMHGMEIAEFIRHSPPKEEHIRNEYHALLDKKLDEYAFSVDTLVASVDPSHSSDEGFLWIVGKIAVRRRKTAADELFTWLIRHGHSLSMERKITLSQAIQNVGLASCVSDRELLAFYNSLSDDEECIWTDYNGPYNIVTVIAKELVQRDITESQKLEVINFAIRYGTDEDTENTPYWVGALPAEDLWHVLSNGENHAKIIEHITWKIQVAVDDQVSPRDLEEIFEEMREVVWAMMRHDSHKARLHLLGLFCVYHDRFRDLVNMRTGEEILPLPGSQPRPDHY